MTPERIALNPSGVTGLPTRGCICIDQSSNYCHRNITRDVTHVAGAPREREKGGGQNYDDSSATERPSREKAAAAPAPRDNATLAPHTPPPPPPTTADRSANFQARLPPASEPASQPTFKRYAAPYVCKPWA
ncbi:hypothetical protein M0804_001518 [Polistes exclamans]|nr:hypothetical protein M0804_001518 [Polistes exclamans]